MKKNIPSFIEIYQSLIKIPSVSSEISYLDQSNKKIINLLSNYFHDLGFFVSENNILKKNNKFNMLASSNKAKTGGLLFAGHTDTVAFEERFWNSDPFILKEKNNKLFGLGTADMKGFFAFLLDAISEINLKKLKNPLHILATADEETDMSGANFFSKNTTLKPYFTIIGEPTSLKPVIAHKGHISYSIHVYGKSGHSGNPMLGINSIDIMHEIIKNLLKLREFLKKNYIHHGFSIPYTTINLGLIQGGYAVNQICDFCKLYFDIRPLPTLTTQNIDTLIHDTLYPINKKWPNIIKIKKIHQPISGYIYAHDHNVIKKIEKISEKSKKMVNYCTEASFLQSVSPVVILGPGSINQAHQANEFMDCSFIKPTKKIIKNIIKNFCY